MSDADCAGHVGRASVIGIFVDFRAIETDIPFADLEYLPRRINDGGEQQGSGAALHRGTG
jgi:hypothetical protein